MKKDFLKTIFIIIIIYISTFCFSCSKVNDVRDVSGFPEDILEENVYNRVQSNYDSLGCFEHGTAIVKSNLLYGLINHQGDLVLPCDYERIGSAIDSVNIRFIKQNSKWGIIDYSGNILIKCHYDKFNTPSDRIHIPFELNGKWGIVDIHDNIQQQFKYDEIYTFNDYFVAKFRGAWGIETYDNEVLLEYEYDDIFKYLIEKESVYVKKGEKYGVVNREGRLIAKCEYDNYPFANNGYIVLRKDNKYGLIDANDGHLVIPFMYDGMDDYNEELLAVEKNGKYGYINIKNEIVIPFQYDDAVSFSEGLAMVGKVTGTAITIAGTRPIITYGFISKRGQLVIPYKFKHPNFTFQCVFKENLCPYGVYKGPGSNIYANTFGFINKKGEIVVPAQFDEVEEFINGLAVVKQHDKYGIINSKGEIVVPCEYERIGSYDKNDSIISLQDNNFNEIACYNIRRQIIRK